MFERLNLDYFDNHSKSFATFLGKALKQIVGKIPGLLLHVA